VIRTFGGADDDIGYAVQQTSDGGYVVAGDSRSGDALGEDVYLVRSDAGGNEVWTGLFGAYGGECGYAVVETPDGDFIVVGSTDSFGQGDDDLYEIRVDAGGDSLRASVLRGGDDEVGRSVRLTADGGCIIAGYSGSYVWGEWDIYLVRQATEAAVSLTIRPRGPAVVGSGDVLEFESTVSNHRDEVVEGDYWLTLMLPDSSEALVPDELLSYSGRISGQVFPLGTLEMSNALMIDGAAVPGIYRLIARIGVYSDLVVGEASFPFEVID
jgi:hypothetical protein